jgi:hypothetical protein
MRALIVATVVVLSGLRIEGQDCQDVGGTSPIVINFGTGGYLLTGSNAPVEFDIRATGQPLRIGWTAAGADEAFLCLDRDHSGGIENGAELFGNATPMNDGTTARHGFVALTEYDENHDAVIDKNDAIWAQLLLWRDLNHDAISQPTEIMAVADSTLRAIRLDAHWTGRRDSTGNAFRYESQVLIQRQRTATPRPVYDIFFAQWPADDHAAARNLSNNVHGDFVAPDRNDPLDSLWPEVAETYNRLHSPQGRGERLRAYAQLTSSMKSAIWIHQFRIALAEHPEFSPEQRTVLDDAIALFTPEFFEITFESPNWTDRVDRPLQKLTQRANDAFGVVLAGQLFAQLGPDNPNVGTKDVDRTEPSQPSNKPHASFQRLKSLRPAPEDLPNCYCSTTSDYCSFQFGPWWSCFGGGCVWGVNWGCGSALRYPCNGLCNIDSSQYG